MASAHPFRFLFILLAVALLPAACAYRPPTLTVADARISEQTEAGYVITFDIDAANDNAIELPLARIDYVVFLDGQRVFTGTRSAEASLRRRGVQRLTLPAAVPADAMPPGECEYELRGRLTYLIPGRLAEVLFDAGVLRPRVGFSAEGQLDTP